MVERDPGRGWTLITVTYNSDGPLSKYWANGAPDGARWIVVDNGSSDTTVDIAEKLGAEVFRLGRNFGFGAANNIGLRAANTPYVAFVNPDVTVDGDSLHTLAHVARSTGGLVAPQLTNPDGSLQANGRGYPLLIDKVRHRLTPANTHVQERYRRYAADGEDRVVCWVMGAVVAGQLEVLRRLGGWDEHFFLYYEDKDLCLRAWRLGHSVTVVGSERWVHGWARETTKLRFTPWRREIASMAKFYARYPEFLVCSGLARRRHSNIELATSS